MKKYIPFISFWALNSFLIFLANQVFPANFVLGNARYSYCSAIIVAGFFWTSITWVLKPTVSKFKVKLEGRFRMFIFYWLANSLAIWLTARIQPITGLGITRYYWAFLLGFAGNLVQYGLWKLGKFKKLLG